MTPCRVLLGADDEVGQWIASRAPEGLAWIPGSGCCLGFTHGPRLIAGAAFFRWNGASVEVGFVSESPRWMNRTNLWQLFSYPFEQLHLQRVTAIANASNVASRRLLGYLSFTPEATLARASLDGDQIVYRLFREDCIWIRSSLKAA